MIFKGHRFPAETIIVSMYLYMTLKDGYRKVEGLMRLIGYKMDHTTIQRWVQKFGKILVKNFKKRHRLIGDSWYIDETYVKVKTEDVYLYRGVDKAGNTINFYLSKKRDLKAAKKFLLECIKLHSKPEKITIDKSGSNIAAVDSINDNLKNKDKIEKRTSKYLNNRVEQDHRQIKQKCKQVLGFKSFESAAITLYGVEIVHALQKEQKKIRGNCVQNAFQEFKKLIA